MATAVDELLTELIAIRSWDADYLRRSTHDHLDDIAWVSRRKRESEIIWILAAFCLYQTGPNVA